MNQPQTTYFTNTDCVWALTIKLAMTYVYACERFYYIEFTSIMKRDL